MRDIKIPGERIRTELRWLGFSFLLAVVLNIYSMVRYKSSWTEIFTSLHIVLLVALILYVLLLFFRGLASLIIRLTSGRK